RSAALRAGHGRRDDAGRRGRAARGMARGGVGAGGLARGRVLRAALRALLPRRLRVPRPARRGPLRQLDAAVGAPERHALGLKPALQTTTTSTDRALSAATTSGATPSSVMTLCTLSSFAITDRFRRANLLESATTTTS